MGWSYSINEDVVSLGLKGTEFVLFAMIHSLTQAKAGCCYATRETMAERCGVNSVRTIDKALTSLLKKGLIQKSAGVIFGETKTIYTSCAEFAHPCKNCTPTRAKSAPATVQNLHTPHAEFAPNNNIDNVVDKSTTKNIKIEREDAPASPSPSRRFTPPTVDEVRDYCRSRHNAVNAEAFVAFYTSNGWKVGKNTMKDWKAAVITWEKRDQTHTTPVFTGYTNTRTTAR